MTRTAVFQKFLDPNLAYQNYFFFNLDKYSEFPKNNQNNIPND